MKISNTFFKHDDYAEIIVHSRKHGDVSFKIDLDDLERCSKIHWGLNNFKTKTQEGFYCSTSDFGKRKLLLHRFVMNANKNVLIDHINRDVYDNRKCNLRTCNRFENRINSKLSPRNKSGHKGVYWVTAKGINKWLASICINGKLKHLGYFDEKEDAIKTRKEAELKYYGKFVVRE